MNTYFCPTTTEKKLKKTLLWPSELLFIKSIDYLKKMVSSLMMSAV